MAAVDDGESKDDDDDPTVQGIGSRFGPANDAYELGEEIGSGAVARVYACKRLSTGEKFAAKVVNLQRMRLIGDFDALMVKLDREVHILRNLRHPRIVNLMDVYRTRSWCFLVLELVPGGELFDPILKNRGLNELEARYVFRQLLEALEYMHSRHVIHRDIKPENILIASSRPAPSPNIGTLREIKVADFGLSKVVSDGNSFAKTFVGTPQYWAPEVLDVQRGTGTYTQAADFWSLGAVLFVMLSGRYPFDGKKQPLEVQIQTATYNMKTAVWEQISSDAKAIVSGLLVVKPSDRMGLEDCFRHPWVTGGEGSSSPQLPPVVLGPDAGNGPLITEVSADHVSGGAVPVVTEPSFADLSRTSSDERGTQERRSPTGYGDGSRDHGSPLRGGASATVQVPATQVGGGAAVGAKPDMGTPQETIFCLNELLKLQVSIASSLELACLAFRHADLELSEGIRKCFRQARDLSQHAANVVSTYAEVAQQVSELVLPDLRLAVQEKEPSLAVGLLGMVKGWVAKMKTDGEDIQSRYMALQDSVHSLIHRAQLTKSDADRRLAEAVQAESLSITGPPTPLPALAPPGGTGAMDGLGPAHPGQVKGESFKTEPRAHAGADDVRGGGMPVSLAPPPTPGGSKGGTFHMSDWTRHLFDQLTQLKDSPSAEGTPSSLDCAVRLPEAPEAAAEAWKRDVLELLFMAPGIMPSQLPPPRLESVTTPADVAQSLHGDGDCSVPSPDNISTDGVSSAELSLVLHAPTERATNATAEAVTHSSAALLRALRELKRVDEILHGCSAFWSNMDGTVQKLAQMKEHTECLVKFAGNSKALLDRFEQRLAEYSRFWSSLERLCRQYVLDHQASSKRMYEMIREVADAADVIDTAHTARMCMMLRDAKRRQGFAVE